MSRHILEESVKSLIDINNNIYTKISWLPKEKISADDYELIRLFNSNIDITQILLDFLYPERHKGDVRKLRFKRYITGRYKLQEVSDS